MLSNHHNDNLAGTPSHTTTPISLSTPRCNADDVKAGAMVDAFKPLADLANRKPDDGGIDIIEGEIVDEGEVDEVAGEILDSYGDNLGLVEHIAMGFAREAANETRGGEPEKLGDIAVKVFAGMTKPEEEEDGDRWDGGML